MRTLNASDLLWLWEWGSRRHTVDRALLILSAALPDMKSDELASLTIGNRDRHLFETRGATFGDKLYSQARCPRCASELQFSLGVADLKNPSQPPEGQPPFAVELGGIRLQLRCLDSRDLADATLRDDPGSASGLLLERCIVRASRDGESVAAGDLPPQVMDAAISEVARQDPQADIQVDLECPDCGHEWQLVFDIASYLWEEIASRAPQLLYEVHTLARAYGWTESDILALSPARREAYLEMVS